MGRRRLPNSDLAARDASYILPFNVLSRICDLECVYFSLRSVLRWRHKKRQFRIVVAANHICGVLGFLDERKTPSSSCV